MTAAADLLAVALILTRRAGRTPGVDTRTAEAELADTIRRLSPSTTTTAAREAAADAADRTLGGS